MKSHRRIAPVWIVLLAFAGSILCTQAAQKKFPPVKPAKGKQSLMFQVDTPQVNRLWVRVLNGPAIINTVKIIGGQEIRIGAHFTTGQIWSQNIDATDISALRVNVDKAENSLIELRIFH